MPHQQGPSSLAWVRYYRDNRGCPTSMGAYGILPMLHSLLDFILTNDLLTRKVAFADDVAVAGK